MIKALKRKIPKGMKTPDLIDWMLENNLISFQCSRNFLITQDYREMLAKTQTDSTLTIRQIYIKLGKKYHLSDRAIAYVLNDK